MNLNQYDFSDEAKNLIEDMKRNYLFTDYHILAMVRTFGDNFASWSREFVWEARRMHLDNYAIVYGNCLTEKSLHELYEGCMRNGLITKFNLDEVDWVIKSYSVHYSSLLEYLYYDFNRNRYENPEKHAKMMKLFNERCYTSISANLSEACTEAFYTYLRVKLDADEFEEIKKEIHGEEPINKGARTTAHAKLPIHFESMYYVLFADSDYLPRIKLS